MASPMIKALMRRLFSHAGEQRAERQVSDGRQHGMAARKAGGIDACGMGHEIGPRTLEAHFQTRREKRSADDGNEDENGRAPLSRHQQIDDGCRSQKREDRVAAEAREIARGFFQPTRTQRIGEILRIAQREQDRAVEGMGLAFEDLIGDRDEGPGEEPASGKRQERPDFIEAQANPEVGHGGEK